MSVADLHAHLKTGNTHTCQCWAVERTDGVTLGFTDHDERLTFDGITFAADSGMTAKALSSTTGLAVDNTEAVGILSAASITEADIAAGRYDNAGITIWQVQWDNLAARQVRFRPVGKPEPTAGAILPQNLLSRAGGWGLRDRYRNRHPVRGRGRD